MKIEVSGMQDPESGLAKIEYKVDDRFDIFKTSGWKIYRPVSGNPKYAIGYTRTEDVSAVTGLSSAKVTIRLTNAVGMQTTRMATVPIVFSSF